MAVDSFEPPTDPAVTGPGEDSPGERETSGVSTPQTLRTRDGWPGASRASAWCRPASSACTPGAPTPADAPRRAGCRRTAAWHARP